MISSGRAGAICRAYADGLTSSDLDRVVSLFSSDATVRDPVTAPAVEGSDALRGYYDRAGHAVLDMVVSGPIGVAEDGSSAAMPIRALVRRASGEMVIIESIDVFEFDPAGKISRLTAYYGSHNVRSVMAPADQD